MTFEEFIKTPININSKKLPIIQFTHNGRGSMSPARKPRKMLEIPVRPRTTDNTCLSDRLAKQRIQAFSVQHREIIKKKEKQEERSWVEEERYRQWKARKLRENTYGLRKATNGNSNRDRGVLEKVIMQRNDYYAELDSKHNKAFDEEEEIVDHTMRSGFSSISRKYDDTISFNHRGVRKD